MKLRSLDRTGVNADLNSLEEYRGEVCVILGNVGRDVFTVKRGMRIAQMVIAPVVRAEIDTVSDLPATVRGTGGFGHTGV